MKKNFKLWKYSYFWIFIISSLSFSIIFVSFFRTLLFNNLNHAILGLSYTSYKFNYLLISLCNIFEYCFVKFLLDFVILHLSANNRMNEQFIQCISNEDLSHRIFADQKYIVENFYKMIFYFCYSIVGALIFFPKYILLTLNCFKTGFYSIISIVIISCFFMILTKHLSKKFSSVLMKNEDYLRKLMYSWNDKNALNDLKFPSEKFQMYIKKSRDSEIGVSFLSNIYQLGQVLILLIPYLMYAKACMDKEIEISMFYQITNYLTGAILSFTFIDSAFDYLGKYIVNRDRLKNIKINDNIINSEDKILIKNLIVKYGEKTIIKNFNLQCFEGEKYNVVAAHGKGKTTLFKAIKDQIDFDGEIHYPKLRTYKISENFVIPENCKLKKTDAFIKNCELLEVDYNLDLNKCSGSQKWRLVAAYSLCYDFIIWDDPFSGGESNYRIIELFFKKMKSGIIFSSKSVRDMSKIEF